MCDGEEQWRPAVAVLTALAPNASAPAAQHPASGRKVSLGLKSAQRRRASGAGEDIAMGRLDSL